MWEEIQRGLREGGDVWLPAGSTFQVPGSPWPGAVTSSLASAPAKGQGSIFMGYLCL